MTVEFNEFVRKPFVVDAVEITEDNIKEIAEYIGEFQTKKDGTPYIYVNRKIVPNVFRVYVGFYMTKMGDNIRCYTPKIFHAQFTDMTPDIKKWVDFMNTDTIIEE